jgi:[ribosomal protein S18]-alanine N-acetyltransferase
LNAAVNVKLRNYKPEDFDALYEIDQVCYDQEVAYSKRELKAYLRFKGSECVVAEAENEIAGFCISARREKQGYIVTIDVLPEYRRSQIGTQLLAEIERRLAEAGAREVTLETATDNSSAVAFWKRHGYRNLGIRQGYYPNGRDAYAMMKCLDSRQVEVSSRD